MVEFADCIVPLGRLLKELPTSLRTEIDDFGFGRNLRKQLSTNMS